MSKNLILVFSHTGENYFGGTIRNISKGNSEIAAEYIQEAVGGDLFRIEPVNPYPENYQACTEKAKEELQNHARPAVKQMPSNFEDYENVFICGPCWWGTYPAAVFTLTDSLDFHGKHVFPLMTHEGSRMGHSERDLKASCKGAVFGKGLPVHGSEVRESKEQIQTWAKDMAA